MCLVCATHFFSWRVSGEENKGKQSRLSWHSLTAEGREGEGTKKRERERERERVRERQGRTNTSHCQQSCFERKANDWGRGEVGKRCCVYCGSLGRKPGNLGGHGKRGFGKVGAWNLGVGVGGVWGGGQLLSLGEVGCGWGLGAMDTWMAGGRVLGRGVGQAAPDT